MPMPGASRASQPMPIPARSARAQRAQRATWRESGPSGPSDAARDARRLNKPTETEQPQPTNTRALADYYSVPEPWRAGEPRCIAPRDSRARDSVDPEPRTLPGVAAVAPGPHGPRGPHGPHGPHIGHGGEINPWQAFGNTLYEAWLKGPCES